MLRKLQESYAQCEAEMSQEGVDGVPLTSLDLHLFEIAPEQWHLGNDDLHELLLANLDGEDITDEELILQNLSDKARLAE